MMTRAAAGFLLGFGSAGIAVAQEEPLAVIRYGTNLAVSIPDQSSRSSPVVVEGVGSPILNVRVLVHITHPSDSELDIALIGPDGTRVDLSSGNGGSGADYGAACTPDDSMTTFDDGAITAVADGTAPFVGSFRPEEPLAAFIGKVGPGSANGTWTLNVGDNAAGNVGMLRCWYLLITADVTAPISLDDAYATPQDTPLVVLPPGVLANDDTNGGGPMTAAIVGSPSNGSLAFNTDGSFTYTPNPGHLGPDVFVYRATNSIGTGNMARVDITVAPPPPIAKDDVYATPFQTPLNVPPPGVLANDTNPVPTSSMIAGLVTEPSHGTLDPFNPDGSFTYVPAAGYVGPDSFTYRAIGVGGTGNIATVFITVNPPTSAQPPTGLYTYSVAGNLVTLRWTPPAVGGAPTQYVLEGGLGPGEVMASYATGSPYPVFTFVAPTGSFYARVHSLVGTDRSVASNEIRLHVNVPVPPSTPADLLSLVNGPTLDLAWRNSFAGGPPTGMALEVSGAYNGAFALPAGDTFSFAGVPAGTYTLRLYAVNPGGVSAPSPPVTLTFPSPCPGAPAPPSGFLAYRIGNTIFVIWDPPTSGPAPTSYIVHVTGAFNGSFPTSGRALSSPVVPGTYNLSAAATNVCGTSAATPVQSVVVP
ncbi:MAG: Ig-like domain-containing protein [Vicinamibacterales bacterium]